MRRRKKTHSLNTTLSLHAPQTSLGINFSPSTSRRSAPRKRRKSIASLPKPGFDDDDDDDEGKGRKVKLVAGLPESSGGEFNHKRKQKQKRSHSRNGDPNAECGNPPAQGKKSNISVLDSGSGEDVFEANDGAKGTDASKDGSPLETGPTALLPDKKLLVFILDKLQKKDTHNAFSEPVDIDELPDYFEVVQQPMDFGTVRKKLDSGAYKNLEQLEGDVFLICSNAMQYNDPETVFYRQARAIRELAKREFDDLRREGGGGGGGDGDEPHVKVVRRRGRPPNKSNLISSTAGSFPADPGVPPDVKVEEKTIGSCGYNLRKAPALSRFRFNDQFVSSYRLRNGESYSDYSEWNNEFPASILRADMRHGKKQFTVDETRRDTFRPQSPSNRSPQLLASVGLHELSLAYSSSLARFAANLGSPAWKMASRRIESISPSGAPWSPGWLKLTAQPSSFSAEWQKSSCNSDGDGRPNRLMGSAASDSGFAGGARQPPQEPNYLIQVAGKGEPSPRKTPFPTWQQRNGSYSMTNGASLPTHTAETWYRNPHLQDGFGVSPSDTNPVGSPRQPELALQL